MGAGAGHCPGPHPRWPHRQAGRWEPGQPRIRGSGSTVTSVPSRAGGQQTWLLVLPRPLWDHLSGSQFPHL